MNFYKYALIILAITMYVDASGRRLQARGNMRGTVTFASGLSPIQVKIIQLIARRRCIQRLGRFANQFC